MKFAKPGRINRCRVRAGLVLAYLCLGLSACRSTPPLSESPSGIPAAYASRPQLQGKQCGAGVQTAEG